MSGEKCSSYMVIENARRREKALRRLRRDAAAADERLRAVVARAQELTKGVVVPRLEADSSEADLNRFIAAAAEAAAQLKRRIFRREMVTRLESFRPERVQSLAVSAPSQAADADLERRKSLAAAQIERLRAPDPAESEKIQTIAGEFVACEEPERARRLKEQLEYAVQKSNEASDKRSERAAEVEALRERLRGLDNAQIGQLRERLDAIAAGASPVPADLPESIERARKAELRRMDEAYVTSVLREELRKAGYTVDDEDFTTVMASGGKMILPDERNAGYAMSFSADPDKKLLVMNVARIDDGTSNSPLRAGRDREVEDDFCGRYFGMAEGLDRAGISHVVEQHRASGERPVEIVRVSDVRRRPSQQRKRAPLAKQLPGS